MPHGHMIFENCVLINEFSKPKSTDTSQEFIYNVRSALKDKKQKKKNNHSV